MEVCRGQLTAHLQGRALKAHKEGAPFMKVPPLLMIGHGESSWTALDFNQLPPPVKCCCCWGLGGFPCCPHVMMLCALAVTPLDAWCGSLDTRGEIEARWKDTQRLWDAFAERTQHFVESEAHA